MLEIRSSAATLGFTTHSVFLISGDFDIEYVGKFDLVFGWIVLRIPLNPWI
jgi:hypothetical protein